MDAWVVRSGRKGEDVSHLFEVHSIAAIGWGLENLSWVRDREEIKDKLRVVYPEMNDGSVAVTAGIIYRFVKEISVGDLILTPPVGSAEVWIGHCRGPYEYRPELINYYEDVRRVEWLRKIPRPELSGPLQSSISSELTVFSVSKHIKEIERLIDVPSPPPPLPPPQDPWSPANVAALADELLWEPDHLQEIIDDLQEKRQVIFYGPPGTGKTYVAKRIAKHAQDCGGGFEIVQFHPSYSYEDFVEGFRPRLINEQPGFELTRGPLRRIAEQARPNPDATFILVIDELNRGNVAKVFGELYFLLEYRDEAVRLQYDSDEEGFSLPANLWFICTMNTADRSIALMDAALRRRFYFAPFFPDKPPVEGLLRRWLVENDPDNVWVADLVDKANEKLDRDTGIGPSYFMDPDRPLDESRVRRIWNRAVIPYVEEQCFGDDAKLAEFDFDRLKGQIGGAA